MQKQAIVDADMELKKEMKNPFVFSTISMLDSMLHAPF